MVFARIDDIVILIYMLYSCLYYTIFFHLIQPLFCPSLNYLRKLMDVLSNSKSRLRKSILFCSIKDSFLFRFPMLLHKSHLTEYIGNAFIPDLRMTIHDFLIS